MDNIRRDLCRFIHREIWHVKGAFFEHDSIWVDDPNVMELFTWKGYENVF